MQALFYLKTLAVVAALTSFMFHVKHYEQSQHYLSALKFSITFLENNQQTPPHPNFYKIYVDNILINVEKLLKRESRKYVGVFSLYSPRLCWDTSCPTCSCSVMPVSKLSVATLTIACFT